MPPNKRIKAWLDTLAPWYSTPVSQPMINAVIPATIDGVSYPLVRLNPNANWWVCGVDGVGTYHVDDNGAVKLAHVVISVQSLNEYIGTDVYNWSVHTVLLKTNEVGYKLLPIQPTP